MLANGRGIAALQTLAALSAGLGLLCLTWLPARGDREIQVQDGDTLSSISLKAYGDVSHVQAIAARNGLSSPDAIYPGETLRLPGFDGPDLLVATPSTTPLSGAWGSVVPGPVIPPLVPPASPPASVTPIASAGKTAPRAGPVVESGLASWYGADFDGQTTKCGQTYSEWDYTAASNVLPCGTVVEVTNEANGLDVVVTITDTGDFQPPDILDLSRAAFQAIASVDTGVITVDVATMAQ